MVPGHSYVAEDRLPEVRRELMAGGRHPKVLLKDASCVRALVYICHPVKDEKRKGTVYIHGLPEQAREIQAWLRRLEVNLPYKGEGLPNITKKVLLTLLKDRERTYLTGEQKAQLLEEHNFACSLCGAKNDNLQWDHESPLSQAVGQEESFEPVFQPLCVSCHNQKSAQESHHSLESDILASHFNPQVWAS